MLVKNQFGFGIGKSGDIKTKKFGQPFLKGQVWTEFIKAFSFATLFVTEHNGNQPPTCDNNKENILQKYPPPNLMTDI